MCCVENCHNVTEISELWNLALHTNLENYSHEIEHLHASLHHLVKQKPLINNSICTQDTVRPKIESYYCK